MIRIETERLIVRNYQETDVADFHEYMSLPYTAHHEPFEPLSWDDCVRVVRKRTGIESYFLFELKESGKAIGHVGYEAKDYDTYEIGYDMNVAYEKHGYATEATAAMMEYLYTEQNARRLIAECNEENVNSWRLLERLGFRREGHLIEDVAFKKDAAGNPIYVNSYLYAQLRREWEAWKNRQA